MYQPTVAIKTKYC